MAESDAFPPSTPPSPTATEAATAAVKAVLDQQRADADQAVASQDFRPDAGATSTPETAPETPPSKTLVAGASTTESLSENLLDRALAVDFTEDDARAMPVSALRRAVTRLEANRQPVAEPVFELPRETEPEDYSLPPLKPEDPQYDFDPNLRKGFDARDQAILEARKDAAEARKAVQDIRQAQETGRVQSIYRQFEKLVAADEVLGETLGGGKTPLKGTKEQELCSEMLDVMGTQLAKGKSVEEAYRVAARGLHADKFAGREVEKLGKELSRKATQMSRKPTASKTTEMPFGRERAIKALQEAKALMQ